MTYKIPGRLCLYDIQTNLTIDKESKPDPPSKIPGRLCLYDIQTNLTIDKESKPDPPTAPSSSTAGMEELSLLLCMPLFTFT